MVEEKRVRATLTKAYLDALDRLIREGTAHALRRLLRHMLERGDQP